MVLSRVAFHGEEKLYAELASQKPKLIEDIMRLAEVSGTGPEDAFAHLEKTLKSHPELITSDSFFRLHSEKKPYVHELRHVFFDKLKNAENFEGFQKFLSSNFSIGHKQLHPSSNTFASQLLADIVSHIAVMKRARKEPFTKKNAVDSIALVGLCLKLVESNWPYGHHDEDVIESFNKLDIKTRRASIMKRSLK